MTPEQPRRTDENDAEFNDWNRIHNENENEKADKAPSFDEHMAKLFGSKTIDSVSAEHEAEPKAVSPEEEYASLSPEQIPEGVRDAQDYREYKEELEAKRAEAEKHHAEYLAERDQRRAEKTKESYDYLTSLGYTEERIDSMIYQTDFEVTEDGKYKRTESGALIPYIDKERMRQPVEYLFDYGISIKDLDQSGIIALGHDSLSDVGKFAEDFYTLTDEYYFPDFNEKHQPLHSLASIIEKRKNHEPLSEEDRDFAYDCYPDNIKDLSLIYLDNNIANRLLFGGDTGIFGGSESLSEEAARLSADSPDKFVDRIGFVDAQRRTIWEDYEAGWGDDEARRNFEQAQFQIKESIWKNLPTIYEKVDDIDNEYYLNKEALDSNIENNPGADVAVEYGDMLVKSEKLAHRRSSLGHALLRNCEFSISPVTWSGENDYNPTGMGLGETMIKCGISSDEILDTYFGGPEQAKDAAYEPTYPHLEARRIGTLIKMGIPKADIIDNIRRKNEKDRGSVSIFKEEVEDMREAGVDNADILDAMQPGILLGLERRREELRGQGFSDGDFVNYLAEELRRKG